VHECPTCRTCGASIQELLLRQLQRAAQWKDSTAGILFKRIQYAHPDGGNSGSERHPLILHEVKQAWGCRFLPGNTCLLPFITAA